MEKIPSAIGIGTDLEAFLFDNEAQRIVPCVGILDGTKDEPFPIKGYPKGYYVQEDNVMVEFNIPPAENLGQWYKSVRKAKVGVVEELQRRHGTRYSLYTRKHTHKFRGTELQSRQAQTIGCEADYDAYEGGKMRVNPPAPGLDRSCGGHVHLGGDFKCPDFVAALFAELFIGVRARQTIDPTDPRARWYGQPGIYRPKPYGVEYRTPNNQWAMDGGQLESVGDSALRCARYLTETDAVSLQKTFRKIPWLKVREYMLEPTTSEKSQSLWTQLMMTAKRAGAPV